MVTGANTQSIVANVAPVRLGLQLLGNHCCLGTLVSSEVNT